MGEAFITRRGGGGGSAGLNFEVVGGTTQPRNPKENTIWINTAQKIHRWDFSAGEPYLVSKTKNLNCYPFYDPSATISGVAYTDRGDGTVTANGTATADATFRISFTSAKDNAVYLPAGKYFLSGCPAGGSSATYRVEVKSISTSKTLAADYGAGAGFTLDAPDALRCNIVVASGTTVSALTFKPQLEKGSAATSFVMGSADGQAWIVTDSPSALEFNALNKNGISVYPVGCKQYISGEWANVEAYDYKGEWVQFSSVAPPYFYKDGESSVELLGNGTNSGGYITLTSTNDLKQPEAGFVIPDIEKYSTISCVISSYSGFTPIVYIRQISTETNVATAKPSAQGETVSVDLSGLGLSGNDYYFVLHTEATWVSTGATNGYWSHSTVKTNHIWGA